MHRSITIILLLLSGTVRAESFEDIRGLHDIAHTGGGFVVNAVSYGVWKKILRPEDRLAAHVLAVLTTALVAAGKEASDVAKPGGRFSGRDFGYSILGAGVFSGCALSFDF